MKTEGSFSRAGLYLGTSGWAYGHWRQVFYPADLPAKDRLQYYAQHFPTTEVNYSFYHLPRPSTYRKWYNETPAGFVFAVKASRFITHIKKLKEVEEAWTKFIEHALHLKEKLGPVLFQFPPGFSAQNEEIIGLREFLALINSRPGRKLRFAFEFRHKSWCCQQVYDLLRGYNAAWVIADSSRYPKAKAVTADFIYVRMHGPQAMFGSAYSSEELGELAREIKEWLSAGLDVYVYFNNDFHGYAIANARELTAKLPGD
ncbi:MAG: DUF72 domain-containing protein [Bacillota bacterium]